MWNTNGATSSSKTTQLVHTLLQIYIESQICRDKSFDNCVFQKLIIIIVRKTQNADDIIQRTPSLWQVHNYVYFLERNFVVAGSFQLWLCAKTISVLKVTFTLWQDMYVHFLLALLLCGKTILVSGLISLCGKPIFYMFRKQKR